MRRFLVILMVFFAAAFLGTVYAVNFTVSLTQSQVDAIQREYADKGGSSGTGFATAQLWFADQINDKISEYTARQLQADKQSLCSAFNSASSGTKTSTCTALSLNPCPAVCR